MVVCKGWFVGANDIGQVKRPPRLIRDDHRSRTETSTRDGVFAGGRDRPIEATTDGRATF